MKETILYENIWPSDIPSIIEDKIRIDITPSRVLNRLNVTIILLKP